MFVQTAALMLPFVTVTTWFICILCAIVTVCIVFVNKKSKQHVFTTNGKKAPSPMAWPILGNLISMAGYELPYQSFGVLEKRYGPIISLQLGYQPALVVNGIDNIKEVLIGKSACFDSRPNFKRYHDLFSGNKENCKYILSKRHFTLIWISSEMNKLLKALSYDYSIGIL